MNISKKGTSIIEALVMMVLVTTGIVGLFSIFTEAQKLSDSTALRIEAIQIARDGLEAFENIRDTNWLIFAADHGNCWNTLNYNSACIGASDTSHMIQGFLDGSDRRPYYIYKNVDNRYEINFTPYTNGTLQYDNTSFRNDFRVGYDSDGFYTQSGGIVESLEPIFLRYLAISYPLGGPNSEMIRVRSIVQWKDVASGTPETLELEKEFTNWKNYE